MLTMVMMTVMMMVMLMMMMMMLFMCMILLLVMNGLLRLLISSMRCDISVYVVYNILCDDMNFYIRMRLCGAMWFYVIISSMQLYAILCEYVCLSWVILILCYAMMLCHAI